MIEHETAINSRRKQKKKQAVATKESKREAVAFGLALLFVVGAGSGFAWSVANLVILLNRALPSLMQSHGPPWMPQ